MRRRRAMLTAVVAVGLSMGLATPASADEALDQAFLTAVRDRGVPIKSNAKALDLAHATCDLLNGGGSVDEALSNVKSATKWSDDDAVNFAGLAAYAYCPDKLPQ
ncbi:DUF732 domain-containing protein [Mycobacterium deserti]|uniref:DUF732 domain-containing protein n=1 Tax=Mycobacterium deserti TaxID=2978347 RepID=A0ABT2M661_9MYCO|nr:DUF732 domain-containing protein [Mycobacterium deserti]MCT7657754.1 DUF732 domain-containing protein [Mycobacterium deserti]